MYSQTLHSKIQKECGAFSDVDVTKPQCADALHEMSDTIGKFDIYNIYDTCGSSDDGITHRQLVEAMSVQSIAVDSPHSSARHPQLKSAVNDYPCSGDSVEGWLSQDSVAKALHVKTNTTGMKYNWGPSSASGDLRPLYKKLAQSMLIAFFFCSCSATISHFYFLNSQSTACSFIQAIRMRASRSWYVSLFFFTIP